MSPPPKPDHAAPASAEPDPAKRNPAKTGPAEPDPAEPDPAEPDPAEIDIDPALVVEWLARDPQLQLVDVREPYERDAGHIAGSHHIQLVQLPTRVAELAPERPVVFYCRVGSRSAMAAQALRASGFRAYSMRGGLLRWAQEGRPLAPEGGQVAEH